MNVKDDTDLVKPEISPKTNGKRNKMLALLGGGITVVAVGYAAYYLVHSRYHEDTDDAYVAGNLVQLTPQVAGSVIEINADDTQIVKAGDPVIRLDPADAKVELVKAEAALAQTVQQVSTLYVNNGVYQAQIAQRQADLARAEDDLRRRSSAEAGAVSAEDVAHARDAVKVAKAALQVALEQLASNHAQTGRSSIEQHPNVASAGARLRDAYLADARTTLPAPVTGYVAKRSVQLGQRVAPGTPLMAIVPLDGVWVEANFKEIQVKHVRIGQPVTLSADVYGSSIAYHGKVIGFSAGTGSAFSALPAQNATGNWIKVVQRLPVRIQLDPAELRAHPLRIGLSMQVDVDIHDQSGSQLGTAKNASYQTHVYDDYAKQADAEIAQIVSKNRIAN
ncbi:membrane fusion protein, multidrug efflux system [Collimonas sp. OK307]|uniref:HlyD family secretion protein n=1 Tax=Collimonas sp. OK307 TaxID=1801620 RepID=UPI0008F39668|nr:HlyD family efflux transporter periplasmic adaptor subunit [Collimonas sp. OK307]SFI32435.1 membrane fusion protein, multidrug efflux system [Collimonas sp. OK307]